MDKELDLPNKSLFKIDEVCSYTGVKPYVLRFWESEFPEIAPITSATGQRLYGHKDIQAVALIKKLLFEEKLSIEKAKLRMLESYKAASEAREEVAETISEEEPEDKVVEAAASGPIPVVAEKKGLSEEELLKLGVARQKIEGLIQMANAIKERHQWM